MAKGVGFACRALALATVLVVLVATPVLGVSSLDTASVTPGSGTTATLFTFRVHYTSNSPARPPQSIVAQAGTTTVPLSLETGSPTNGTYAGSARLPVGTHAITFSAVVAQDPPGSPASIPGGTVQVTLAPTPAPTPTQVPTSPPTPRPTPGPTPRPTARPTTPPPPATPRPPGATPRPSGATPAPEPGTGSVDPSPTAAASGVPIASARPSQAAASVGATSPPTESRSPDPSADPEPASGETQGVGRVGWIVLGGMTSTAGALVLIRQWRARPRT